MACERYLDALSDLAAGAAAFRDLDAHLAGCAACRARVAALRQALGRVDAELSAVLGDEPSPALKARIRAAVEADAPSRIHSRWVSPAWLAVAATLLVGLALVVFLIGRPGAGGARIAGKPASPRAAESSAVGRGLSSAILTAPDAVPSPDAPSRAAAAPPRRQASVARSVGARHPVAPQETALPPVEVVVPADEATALLRLADVVAQGHLDTRDLVAALSGTSALLAEPAPIEIRPLEIAPLEPSGPSGT